MRRTMFAGLPALLFIIGLTGCSHVEPWQKGYLARKDMALDTDPAQSRLQQHIYTSKEAASGGYGVGGGGCGCN